jgi:hypothetical protein
MPVAKQCISATTKLTTKIETPTKANELISVCGFIYFSLFQPIQLYASTTYLRQNLRGRG